MLDFLFQVIAHFVLAPTYSPCLERQVPSVLEGLTAVFGMRTGVSLLTKHQHKIHNDPKFG